MGISKYDAVIIGSGPNGLSAGITLAQKGHSVLIREASSTPGGGMRSEALTLPGYIHDVCSAAYPLGVGSPFFKQLPLEKFGLEWIHSPAPMAHPLDLDGIHKAIVLKRSIEETAAQLGDDAEAYVALMKPLVSQWDELIHEALAPVLHLPKNPLLLARFGLQALLPATTLVQHKFQTAEARALFGGIAAHSALPLSWTSSAAVGLILGAAGHAVGWPIPRGGSQSLAQALVGYFKSLGGEIEVDSPVTSISELPPSKWIFLDITPRQALPIVGDRFSKVYRRKLGKFNYGPGVFKMDWALSAPIPWKSSECLTANTIHLGGSFEEMVESERRPVENSVSSKPYVLLCQPSLYDSTRAPEGKHTVWAYCHVPHGSIQDMSTHIEQQIERFAPGFMELILARSEMNTEQLQSRNANLIGGDISGGAMNLLQLLFRPSSPFNPYATPDPGIYFCSSSTPPGPGVHGMCGWQAASAALHKA